MNITYEEQQLMALYNASGTRTGLIAALREMRGYLGTEDAELRALTDSAIGKLEAMTDADYAALDLTPDLDAEGEDAGYEEIQNQWRILTKEKGVDIVVLDMPLLDTRRGKDLVGTFLSDIVLQVLSFVAENERTTIRQRQAEGIAAAKARGVRFGRPPMPMPENFSEVCDQWKAGRINVSQAARICGLPRSTFFYHARTLVDPAR